MKYFGVKCGWLTEEFVPWPNCGVRWMKLNDGTYIDVMFSIFFWYFTKLSSERYDIFSVVYE